jgi:hypothetical protein
VNHPHLNGRNYTQLVALVPGTQPNPRSRAADAVQLSGGRRRSPRAPRVGYAWGSGGGKRAKSRAEAQERDGCQVLRFGGRKALCVDCRNIGELRYLVVTPNLRENSVRPLATIPTLASPNEWGC